MTSFRAQLAERLLKDCPQAYPEFALAYGEPGYEAKLGVVMANWNHVPKRVFDILERAGWGCEWCDEWTVCGNGKAWRTQGDSYFWQPSAIVTNDGELLTRDDDASEWIAEMEMTDVGHPMQVLPGWITAEDLQGAGYTLRNDAQESGFHPGQTDDPAPLARAAFAEGAQAVVFRRIENSQFYSKWQCWVKLPEGE